MPEEYIYTFKKAKPRITQDFELIELNNATAILPYCINQKPAKNNNDPIKAYASFVATHIKEFKTKIFLIDTGRLQCITAQINNKIPFEEIIKEYQAKSTAWENDVKKELVKLDINEDYTIIHWENILAETDYKKAEAYVKGLFGNNVITENEIKALITPNLPADQIQNVIPNKFRKNVLLSATNYIRNKHHKEIDNLTIQDWQHAVAYVIEECAVLKHWMNSSLLKFVSYPGQLNPAMEFLINEQPSNAYHFKHARFSQEEKPIEPQQNYNSIFIPIPPRSPSQKNKPEAFSKEIITAIENQFNVITLMMNLKLQSNDPLTEEELQIIHKKSVDFQVLLKKLSDLNPKNNSNNNIPANLIF